MSQWQNYGFPNNLHLAEPALVISGLIAAINERSFPVDSIPAPGPLAAINQSFISTIENATRNLCQNWFIRPDLSDVFCVDETDLLAKMNNPQSTPHGDLMLSDAALEDILEEPLIKLDPLAPLFSADWALQKYRMLNLCRIHRAFYNDAVLLFNGSIQPNPSYVKNDDNSITLITSMGGEKTRVYTEILSSTSQCLFINGTIYIFPNYYGRNVISSLHLAAANPYLAYNNRPVGGFSDYVLDNYYETADRIYEFDNYQMGMGLGSFSHCADDLPVASYAQPFPTQTPVFPTLPLRSTKPTVRGFGVGSLALTFDLTETLNFYDEEI